MFAVAIFLVTVSSFFLGRILILNETLKTGNEATKRASESINGMIAEKETLIKALSVNTLLFGFDAMEKVLPHYQRDFDDIWLAYIGRDDNKFLFSDDSHNSPARANYVAYERGWYKQAVAAKGEIVVTSPYKAATVDEILISVVKQIGETDGRMTAAALDVSVASIRQGILDTKISKNGYIFLVDGEGQVIAHPESKLMPTAEAFTSLNNVDNYKNALSALASAPDNYVAAKDYDGKSPAVLSKRLR
jgi:methyl-accepting chemotaxis protein